MGDLDNKKGTKIDNPGIKPGLIKPDLIKFLKEYSKCCDQEFTDFVLELQEKFQKLSKSDKGYSRVIIHDPNYDKKCESNDKEGKTYEDYRKGFAGFYAHGFEYEPFGSSGSLECIIIENLVVLDLITKLVGKSMFLLIFFTALMFSK